MIRKILALNFILLSLVLLYLGCTQQPNEEEAMSNDSFLEDLGMGAQRSDVVVFETNQGNIEIQLFGEIAPKAAANMIGLINQGYYDGVVFHRVIEGFMIQGGDPTGTGRGGDSYLGGFFEDEVSPSVTFDRKGLLAMANRGPNTNGSQFFITTAPAPHLNMHHTIFGEVSDGYATVEKIENCPKGAMDRPVEDQKILRAYVK